MFLFMFLLTLFSPTAIVAVDASNAIGTAGLPPMMNKCVRIGPTTVATNGSAPKNASEGTRSNTAEITSTARNLKRPDQRYLFSFILL
jgi:hypothetical protein